MVTIDQSYTISTHDWLFCGLIGDTYKHEDKYSDVVWEILRSGNPRVYTDYFTVDENVIQCGVISVDIPVQDIMYRLQSVTRNSVNLFATSDVRRLDLW